MVKEAATLRKYHLLADRELASAAEGVALVEAETPTLSHTQKEAELPTQAGPVQDEGGDAGTPEASSAGSRGQRSGSEDSRDEGPMTSDLSEDGAHPSPTKLATEEAESGAGAPPLESIKQIQEVEERHTSGDE